MKKATAIVIATVFILTMYGVVLAEEAPQEVFDLAASKLTEIGKEPVIIKAVNAANAERKSLSTIQELDKRWKTKEGITDNMQALMDNACGKYLRDLQNAEPYITKAFAMDNQGANVCMTDRTSDYWQGDENKFVIPFNRGRGGVFIEQAKFDDSTRIKVSQVSVPVMDGQKVIGAITFGVDIDKLN